MTDLPIGICSALNKALNEAPRDGSLFDVYGAAIKVREAFLTIPVTTDQLIAYLVARIGVNLPAVISPPSLVVEITIPLESENEIETVGVASGG